MPPLGKIKAYLTREILKRWPDRGNPEIVELKWNPNFMPTFKQCALCDLRVEAGSGDKFMDVCYRIAGFDYGTEDPKRRITVCMDLDLCQTRRDDRKSLEKKLQREISNRVVLPAGWDGPPGRSQPALEKLIGDD